jgi:hypothetical protein
MKLGELVPTMSLMRFSLAPRGACSSSGNGGHEQLISNGEMFKPAFSERDKKQTMTDLRAISTKWFKPSYIPPKSFLATGSAVRADGVLTVNLMRL